MSIYGADIDHTRPRCAFVYPSRRRCPNMATSGERWLAVCDTHAASLPLVPQDALGATNGPVGSQSAPNPEIALQRPERTDPMTARGTVTVTADTLEDARRQTAEAIAQFTPRWRVVEEECLARMLDVINAVQGWSACNWTVTTTWTEEDA